MIEAFIWSRPSIKSFTVWNLVFNLFQRSTDWGTMLNGRIGRLKVVVPRLVKNWQVEKKNTNVDLHPVVGATVVVEGSVVGGASLVCITWPPPPLIPGKRKLIDRSQIKLSFLAFYPKWSQFALYLFPASKMASLFPRYYSQACIRREKCFVRKEVM